MSYINGRRWFVMLDADGYNRWTCSRAQYARWLKESRTIRRIQRRKSEANAIDDDTPAAPPIQTGQRVLCHFPDGCSVNVIWPPEGWTVVHDYGTHETWCRNPNRTEGR